jgi:hypothetical protein
MPAGHQQGHEGELRCLIRLEHWRQQVALHVMHTQHRNAQPQANAVPGPAPTSSAPASPGPCGIGHAVDVAGGAAGVLQDLFNQWQGFAHMVARGQLRHHAAVFHMNIDLAKQCVGEQAAPVS